MEELRTALARLRISEDDLANWRRRGWLSTVPPLDTEVDELGDPLLYEFIFLRDITRLGLSDAQVHALLADLPRPFTYDPARLAYSLIYGWVEGVPPPSPDELIPRHLYHWLAALAADDRLDELQAIADYIGRLLPDAAPAKGEESA